MDDREELFLLASQEYEASIATTDHCCVIDQDDDDNLECDIDDETFILATQQYKRQLLHRASYRTLWLKMMTTLTSI